ncbi:MAG: hypothetical protein R2788_18920 [Saprospiraceae bacterium]
MGEIEATIQQFEPIKQAVVNIFQDASGSPQMAGYIVWENAENADNESLKAFLKTKLPG